MDDRKGVLPPPPEGGKKKRKRGKRGLRVLGFLLLSILLVYLFRNPLFSGILKSYLGEVLSRELHLPLKIRSLSGSWITGVEIQGVVSGPAEPGRVLRRLELRSLRVSYAPWDLLLGRSTWIRRVRLRGLVLHIDLDQEKGRPSPPSPPPKPLPAFLWKLTPLVDLSIQDFDLHLEGRSIHLREGRFLMDPQGACTLKGRELALPTPWKEKGPLLLRFTRKGPVLEGIRGGLARARLSRARVDFSRFPGTLGFRGNLAHPFGAVEFLGSVNRKELSFRVEGRNLLYAGISSLFPKESPRPFRRIDSLSARGVLLLDALESSRGTWSLSLSGKEGDLLQSGILAGSCEGGKFSFSKLSLAAPWIHVRGKGSLSLEGKWGGHLEGRLRGSPRIQGRFREIPLPAGKGTFSLDLSGSGLRPQSGELVLSMKSLAMPPFREIRNLDVRAALRPGNLVRLRRFQASLGEGSFQGRGEIRFTRAGPRWQGRLQGTNLAPWFFLGRKKRVSLSFLFWGQGLSGTASVEGGLLLDPLPGSGLPRLQAEAALDLAWKRGLLLLPRRLRGTLQGHPFQVTARGALSRKGTSLVLPPIEVEGPGLECSLEGTLPPARKGEAFALAGRLIPGKVPWTSFPALRSFLEIPGFSMDSAAAPLQFEAHLASRRGRLVLRGGEAGAPVLEAEVEEFPEGYSLLDLSGRNLKQARSVRVLGTLPFSWHSLLEGRLPWPPGKGAIRLLGRAAGLHGSALPGKPFRGRAGAFFFLGGTFASPVLALRAWGNELAPNSLPSRKIPPEWKGVEGFTDLVWKEGKLLVEGRASAPFPMEIRWIGEGDLPFSCSRPGPLLKLKSTLSGPLSFQAAFHGAFPSFPGEAPSLPRLSGKLKGSLHLEGSLLRPRARFSLMGKNLTVETRGPGAPVRERIRTLSLEGRVEENRLEGRIDAEFRRRETLKGDFLGEFRPRAFVEGGPLFPSALPLEATAKARGFRLSRIAPFLPFACELNGRITLEGTVSGTWRRPEPEGRILLQGGLLKLPSSLPALDGIQGEVEVKPDSVVIRKFQADSAGGKLELTGRIDSPFSAPRLDLAIRGRDTLLYRSPRLRCRADMDLRAQGPPEAITLSGKVLLTSSRFRAHLAMLSKGIQAATRAAKDLPSLFEEGGIRVERGRGPLFTLEGPVAGNLRFDVALGTKDPFLVETNLFQSALLVDMHIRGKGRSPLLLGQVTSLEGGKILLPGIHLTIRALRAYIDRSDPYMPHIQLACQGRKHSVDVQLAAQGPLDDLEVNLSSTPPHSRKDLVALLATGSLPAGQGGGRAALRTLGSYLGGEVLNYFSGGGEESWIEKRLTLEIGTEIGPSGTENIVAEFMLSPGVFLQGERDVLGYYNLGILFRWTIR